MDPLKYKLDFSNRIQAISYVSFLLAQHFLFALIDEHETKKNPDRDWKTIHLKNSLVQFNFRDTTVKFVNFWKQRATFFFICHVWVATLKVLRWALGSVHL